MQLDLKQASERREIEILDEQIDRRLDLLLANYQRVTANPRSMGYLRFLLRHYAKSPKPWTQCYADNLKRFGPDKTKAVCGVLKDTLRQTTYWRHGKNGHSKVPDAGSPGVAIAEADKGAAPPWGGHKHLSEDLFSIGAMPEECALILEDLDKRCDVFRVLIGLDDAPESEIFS